MDTATVEAAFTSSPTIACTWVWSAGNTVAACDHAALAPLTLTSIALATSAKDTTGTPLASAWSINFTTAAAATNHGTATIYGTAALDGVVWSIPQVVTANASVYVGDNLDDKNGRAFFSFDLAQLPANVTAITGATLGIYQENGAHAGAPYANLGLLHAERVAFGATLDASDLDLVALDFADYVLSGDATVGWKTVEVGASVAAAWTDRATLANRAQFRLRFATNTNSDAAGDTARFSASEGAFPPYLTIQYDYP
jgi:hypothetical protein